MSFDFNTTVKDQADSAKRPCMTKYMGVFYDEKDAEDTENGRYTEINRFCCINGISVH
jgi:hypothetical protein